VIHYDDGNVDGVSMDVEGRIYVARQARACVDVVQDGDVVELLELPAPALITNVCFGGPERSWAFVTDALGGSVWVFHDLPAQGAPVAGWDPPRPGAQG
jgi:gluconolactonase